MRKFLSLLLLLSCGSESERVLYSEHDAIYSQLQIYAQQECVREAEFFDYFDTYAEFDNSPFAVGDIFKISQDSNSSLYTYVKVSQINANDIQLIFNSSSNTYDKVLTYEESDHTDLGTFLKAAVCNSAYDDYFSGISGTSGKTLGFTWTRTDISVADSDDDDSIADQYDTKIDSLKLNSSYPSLFYFYNGTKTHKYDHESDDENDEQSVSSTLTITDVTDADECENGGSLQNEHCEFDDTSSFPTCDVAIDSAAYDLTDYDAKEITLTGTNCELLVSAGGI